MRLLHRCTAAPSVVVVAAAAFLCIAVGRSPSQAATKVTYTGMLVCTESDLTKTGVHAKMTVTVNGTQAQYSRDVYSDTGRGIVGQETGVGAVAENGDVTLKGEWQSAGIRKSTGQPVWDIQGTYTGNLGADGGSLAGESVSTVNGEVYTRKCSVTLAKDQPAGAASPSPKAT
jgi:hypothetical protein